MNIGYLKRTATLLTILLLSATTPFFIGDIYNSTTPINDCSAEETKSENIEFEDLLEEEEEIKFIYSLFEAQTKANSLISANLPLSYYSLITLTSSNLIPRIPPLFRA